MDKEKNKNNRILKMELEAGDIFECRQCGECCKGYGGTYITEADIDAIADFVKCGRKDFIEKFCVKSGEKYLIGQKEDGFCHFFKEKLCSIHPVKPKMCREWPFIRSIVIDPSNWLIMAFMCEGMRTDIPLDVIKYTVLKHIMKRA